MKGKINANILAAFGLVVVMLYCIFRTLSTLAAGSGGVVALKTDSTQGNIEFLLQDLEKSIIVEADTVPASSHPRDPMVPGKPVQIWTSTSPGQRTATKSSASGSGAKVTGLVLDQNPVAIVEVNGVSQEVKVGGLLEGCEVIQIDENGVHILKDGNVVTVQ